MSGGSHCHINKNRNKCCVQTRHSGEWCQHCISQTWNSKTEEKIWHKEIRIPWQYILHSKYNEKYNISFILLSMHPGNSWDAYQKNNGGWLQEIYSWGNSFRLGSGLLGYIPLGWSRSGSVIQGHSHHGRSNEPKNLCPEWIHWFIWSTMIWGISDHWFWSGSSEKNPALYFLRALSICQNWPAIPFPSWWEIHF